MRLILTLLACLITLPALSQGLYTELGVGIRFTNISSYLEDPDCKKAIVIDPADSPREVYNSYSCGGDEPIFVGDIIGWEFKKGTTIALCHKSQWFDNKGELHWTGICASQRLYWKNLFNR
jgi:hypothetical protein